MSRIVLVEWVDASSCSGWHRFGEGDCICHCFSVGVLKREDKEQIVLGPHGSDTGTVADTWAIPKDCIKRIRYLRVK